MRFVWAILISLGAGLAAPSLAHEDHGTEPVPVTNAYCPVTTDEPVDPSIFVEHEGTRVYFCCQRCRKQFLENPDEYTVNVSGSVDSVDASADDHDLTETLSLPRRLIRFSGRFHPLTVHFPIALIITSFLMEGFGYLGRSDSARRLARSLLLVAVPFTAIAAALGWAAGAHASYRGELAGVLTAHRWLGTATATLAVTTLALSKRYGGRSTFRSRAPYLIGLLATSILVGISGHFGGTLIHGLEQYKW